MSGSDNKGARLKPPRYKITETAAGHLYVMREDSPGTWGAASCALINRWEGEAVMGRLEQEAAADMARALLGATAEGRAPHA